MQFDQANGSKTLKTAPDMSSRLLYTQHADSDFCGRDICKQNNESNVSWIYLVPRWVVCPDTEKWPLSKIWRMPKQCVWQSQHCSDSPIQQRRKTSLGSHRHTNTQVDQHTHCSKYTYRTVILKLFYRLIPLWPNKKNHQQRGRTVIPVKVLNGRYEEITKMF